MVRMEKTYKNAVALLDARRRSAVPSAAPATRLAAPGLPHAVTLRGTPSIEGMRAWLHRLGHTDDRIDSLNIIHVAGTKGKGSTCAFVESFLRAHGRRTGFPRKTGLYTSPHLLAVPERIRVDFAPLAPAAFARYVFEVVDGLRLDPADVRARPRYLQLLALVSFHALLRERVDVAVYETHHGGEFCATNVVRRPAATGITAIGMDHVNDLGPSLENIAWHKAGILKPGAPAFAQPQPPAVARVLRARAAEKGVPLVFVEAPEDSLGPLEEGGAPPDGPPPDGPPPDGPPAAAFVFPASLPPEQRCNAALARALADAFLQAKHPDAPALSADDLAAGLAQFAWPGRFQTVADGPRLWCLDGAHNELSIDKAAAWFQGLSVPQPLSPTPLRILVFAQKSSFRDSIAVLRALTASLRIEFDHVIFTRYDETDKVTDEALLGGFQETWHAAFPATTIWTEPLHEHVLAHVHVLGAAAGSVHILVTGSLYLVGSFLRLLGSREGLAAA